MKRKTVLPELLAPAGSPDALTAAINAGADAVYLGAASFGARAYARNFDRNELESGIAYAHLCGKKVYVTLNTLINDKEFDDFLKTAAAVREAGADGVIIADIGAAAVLHRCFPDLPLHASTQMSVHSTAGADLLSARGFTRVVPARELPHTDICAMTEKAAAEIEVFLHGALCVSHSGQCLFSAMVGGRSGNRGECAQPCRLPYNGERFPLSLMDLSLAGHIPELLSSGVSSLKIEGRMKSPAYVYGVTRIYRRLLDEQRNATPEETRALSALFSRSGFTDGYFTGNKSVPMTGVRRDSDKAESRDCDDADTVRHTFPISADCTVNIGEKATLTLHFNEKSASAEGDIPVPAKSAPLTEQAVREQLSRTGGTPFSLKPDDIRLTLGKNAYLPLSSLNLLRRTATDALMPAGRAPRPYSYAPPPRMPKAKRTRAALCLELAQYRALPRDYFDEIYLPLWLLSSLPQGEPLPDGVWLPPVIFDSEEAAVRRMMEEAKARGVTRALCDNLSHIAVAAALGFSPSGGFRLNVRNKESLEVYRAMGVTDICLSPELTLPQARDVGGRVITYGRIPLMLLERCFIKENFGCDFCKSACFSDRRGARFPIRGIYPHRNLLFNSIVTYMGDKQDVLREAALSEFFLFTTESAEETRAAVSAYRAGRTPDFSVRRLGTAEPHRSDEKPGKKSSPVKNAVPTRSEHNGYRSGERNRSAPKKQTSRHTGKSRRPSPALLHDGKGKKEKKQ